MGGFFGGGAAEPQPVDTSYIEKQQAQADEDKAKAERENEAKRRVLLGRRGRSLLQWGTDLGVTNAGVPGGQTTLG